MIGFYPRHSAPLNITGPGLDSPKLPVLARAGAKCTYSAYYLLVRHLSSSQQVEVKVHVHNNYLVMKRLEEHLFLNRDQLPALVEACKNRMVSFRLI